MSPSSLLDKHCIPCESGTPPLTREQARELQTRLHSDWILNDSFTEISRTCKHRNYYQTIAFVNALAWVAHREDHHPDLEVGYNRCRIRYSTHSIGGLSENDFICAAKIDALLNEGS